MLSRFKDYIKEKELLKPAGKVLLAVSGGIDSVCMLHLFQSVGIDATIAHCNFKLRSEESDQDELFVKTLAGEFNMQFHVMHFDTTGYAELQKISIQMAARELRYNWFENLRKLHGYSAIAVAHNADDAIETFFINLSRGTGIQGLTGIRPRNENIIRPLLFAYRSEIEEYCRINNLEYRVDSSNDSDKYLRNRIRHNIIPELLNINSSFKNNMTNNLSHLSDAEKIYNCFVEIFSNEAVENKKDGTTTISIEKLKKGPAPKALLYEIIKNYGFSSKTSSEIFDNINGEPGSIYFSSSKRLVKDRQYLIITDPEGIEGLDIYIGNDFTSLDYPVKLQFRFFEADSYEILNNNNIAAIDADKLVFPLILRKWHSGDYFQPLGMKGIKKISDYFIDSKLSITDKENTWILTSAGEIVWIVGMRLDERYKVSTATKMVYQISLVN
jgi:tRNA(Ile)-lysidine synthase